MKNLRTATASDFKIGTTLVSFGRYEFTIYNKYDDGIWEARSTSGSKVVFECEARHYKIANNR